MRVAVVNIRKMPVTVLDFSMLMRMRMGLYAIPLEIVTVLVVFIVPMLVPMVQRGVLMLMDVAFGEVQPDPRGHQSCCQPKRNTGGLPKHRNRERCAHKWCCRKVGACASGSQPAQGQDE